MTGVQTCALRSEAYGTGLTPEMQAAQAKEMSQSVNLQGVKHVERYERTVADPSVFSDMRGAGRTIAQLWADNGFRVTRANKDRVAGWSNVRQYLWDYTASKPRVFVFPNCKNLIREIPLARYAKNDQEDLDTRGSDHAIDALRYVLATRPIGERPQHKKVGQSMDEKFTSMLRTLDKRKKHKWT